MADGRRRERMQGGEVDTASLGGRGRHEGCEDDSRGGGVLAAGVGAPLSPGARGRRGSDGP